MKMKTLNLQKQKAPRLVLKKYYVAECLDLPIVTQGELDLAPNP